MDDTQERIERLRNHPNCIARAIGDLVATMTDMIVEPPTDDHEHALYLARLTAVFDKMEAISPEI